MLRVGLTGGIGAGKSTAAGVLRDLGAVVVDADAIARQVLEPGSDGLAAVRERFGASVLAADGSLDRGVLGQVVFADPAARRDLEAITHPRIAARTAELVERVPSEAVVVHDVPLLVERHMWAAYHLVLVVAASEQTRLQRVMGTRGATWEEARARMAAQATDEQRRGAADVWLDNEGEPADLERAVRALWADRLEPFNANLLAGTRVHRPERLALVEYEPSWPQQAVRLAGRIQQALDGSALRVDHVGSTSVPGMLGKDVIDLQVGVRNLADADDPAFVEALQRKGFPRVPDNVQDEAHGWSPDPAGWAKRFHGSADPGRVAHVHVRAVGSPAWVTALLFRDWLRAREPARRSYRDHKLEIAAVTTRTGDYTSAKQPWFTGALPQARAWAGRTGWTADPGPMDG